MNGATSLVSVIIPVFNAGRTIEKCIDSVLNQTYRNVEIVAIDDGSNDESYDVIRKMAAIDDRIAGYHKTNGGVSSARNLGLDHATGDWVFFLDSDDWLFPEALEALLDAATKTHSKVAVGETLTASNSSTAKETTGNLTVYNTSDDYKGGYGLGNMVTARLYAKELVENIRFPETLWVLEDMAFNMGIIANNNTFRYVYADVNVQFYNNINPESLSHQYKSEDLLTVAEWFCDHLDSVNNRTIFIDKAIKNIIQYRYETKKRVENSKRYFKEMFHTNIPMIRKAGYFVCYHFPSVYKRVLKRFQ